MGMKTVIMGLGLHGGGLESARYLARRGAELTITDMRDEKILAPAIKELENSPGVRAASIRYVLGCHERADFEAADLVVKNPAVPPDSPFLLAARRVETDISLFLAASPARLTAVTGSKGKSSAASAIYRVLSGREGSPGKARLGGNIAFSPLSFLDELGPADDVVLELSSFQLGDLKGRINSGGGPLLKPRAAVLTAILPDHLDRYGTMDAYVADKRVIYRGQDQKDVTVAAADPWGRSFHRESPGRPLVYGSSPLPANTAGGWIPGPRYPGFGRKNPGDRVVELVPERLLCPGPHQKMNFLAAALALLDMGLESGYIREKLGSFPGLEHRLEFFHQCAGIRFYNDTAATIPEAAAAAIAAFEEAPVLVTGGTDKKLDFTPLVKAAARAKALVLLAGTGSDKLKGLFAAAGLSFRGPYDSLEAAVKAALDLAKPGDPVVLSPGCASFGMFLNEFDRGRQWKEAVRKLAG
jgi:UDP-N-acetylmuramoylalanine--D-glutamate ligase